MKSVTDNAPEMAAELYRPNGEVSPCPEQGNDEVVRLKVTLNNSKDNTSKSSRPQTKLRHRILSLALLKGFGSTIVITAFFVAYFTVLNHPFSEPSEMPLTALDRWMPILPWTAWVYFSLWFYICIPSSLMVRANELGFYLVGAALLSFVGLMLFYFLPSQVPDIGVDWHEYPTLLFLKDSDASGNACPSLHVGFAVYSGLWLSRMLTFLQAGRIWHVANALWGLLIILSTMTTKQHVLVDVLCGAALGLFAFWGNDCLAKKAKFAVFRDSGFIHG